LLDATLATDAANIEALEKLADALAEQNDGRLAEIVDRLRKLAPENPVALHHVAEIRLYQSRFDEAIEAAKRVLERDPKSGRTRNVLAIAYERTFQPNLAEAEFRRSTTLAPEDSVSYNNYGIFLLGRNRISEAQKQFQRAIRLNPENVQGYLGMSEASRQAGDHHEAEKWRQRALRLDPHQNRPGQSTNSN
jgi:Tfp pilus assembly protein PilF